MIYQLAVWLNHFLSKYVLLSGQKTADGSMTATPPALPSTATQHTSWCHASWALLCRCPAGSMPCPSHPGPAARPMNYALRATSPPTPCTTTPTNTPPLMNTTWGPRPGPHPIPYPAFAAMATTTTWTPQPPTCTQPPTPRPTTITGPDNGSPIQWLCTNHTLHAMETRAVAIQRARWEKKVQLKSLTAHVAVRLKWRVVPQSPHSFCAGYFRWSRPCRIYLKGEPSPCRWWELVPRTHVRAVYGPAGFELRQLQAGADRLCCWWRLRISPSTHAGCIITDWNWIFCVECTFVFFLFLFFVVGCFIFFCFQKAINYILLSPSSF